jgi:rhodanese-related sulfurtransferase
MFDRRFFAEAVTLVILAGICGSVANVVAARDRKLAFVGTYPNATVMPQRPAVAEPAPPPADPLDATAEMDPVPVDQAMTATGPEHTQSPAETTPNPVTTQPAETQAASTTTSAVTQKPALKPARQFLPTPDKVSEEITNEEARQLFDAGALFLDARRTGAYHDGHIPGARAFSVWESDIDEKVGALFYEVTDQQQPIVVYCTGGNCEDSHMLAQKLWGIGYENVLVYTDGFPGWLSIDGAVEKGQ